MRLRLALPALLAFAALVAAAVPLGALLAMKAAPGAVADHAGWLNGMVSASFAALVVALGAAAAAAHLFIVKPAEALTRDVQTLAQTPQARELHLPRRHWLDRLPSAVSVLVGKLVAARSETGTAVAQATKRMQEQKSRLEAILLDLDEGVIVSNFKHDILLYNQSAARILGLRESLGLGRPLFGVLTSEPVLHTLEQLTRTSGATATPEPRDAGPGSSERSRRFVCATVDLGTLLEARLSLVREPSGEASGYVISFADVGTQVENLAMRDALLREVMVEWRRPLANVTAAAETLYGEDALEPDERSAFEEIVAKEVATLNQRFRDASRRYELLAAGPWPMADIHSLDLFRAARKHLADSDGIELTLVGVPLWLHADSHTLLLAVEHLIRRLAKETGRRQLDIEAVKGDKYAYVEIAWEGQPVPSATLESWLDEPLKGTIANRTVRQIVERHGSELWSQSRAGNIGFVRIPLQPAQRLPDVQAASSRPAPRPEYYDFDLFQIEDVALAETPLRKLSYVVFDTETTGLKPSEGDELISIGAVRVVNGRILTGETFERLIDPGRDIPEVSIRIHGITPDQVAGKPPARIVLPQFKTFAGQSVLIAYNVAFDMKFLELKQEQSGVVFDNPVLDALLLAIYLHKDAPDHSLSGMARTLGVEIEGRHTALGDAMATAAVWVRLLDLLEAQGIRTFGEAARISTRMMKERQLSSKF